MRKVKITDKLTIEIECLRRKDIKELREKGFNVSTAGIAAVRQDQWDDFIDALIGYYVKDRTTRRKVISALDKANIRTFRKINLELIAETWGAEEEEKN